MSRWDLSSLCEPTWRPQNRESQPRHPPVTITVAIYPTANRFLSLLLARTAECHLTLMSHKSPWTTMMKSPRRMPCRRHLLRGQAAGVLLTTPQLGAHSGHGGRLNSLSDNLLLAALVIGDRLTSHAYSAALSLLAARTSYRHLVVGHLAARAIADKADEAHLTRRASTSAFQSLTAPPASRYVRYDSLRYPP